MTDALGLIEKHRTKPVLVDTSLLVLLLVGRLNPKRIATFKRTQSYSEDDYLLLERLLAQFSGIVTTPHILAQTSDLTDLGGKDLVAVRRFFKKHVEVLEEVYQESRTLVCDPCFERLGLTDAAIATLAARPVLVLTSDLDLCHTLERRGVDCINFNHLRQYGWRS